MTYTDLITRLEGLTEPCRETDAMIAFTFEGYTCGWEGDKFVGRAIDPPHATSWAGSRDQYHKWIDTSGVTPCPAYTASLDEVIALCEKMLNKNEWEVGKMQDRSHGYFALSSSPNTGYQHSKVYRHPHPAIALLIALFKAMEIDNAT